MSNARIFIASNEGIQRNDNVFTKTHVNVRWGNASPYQPRLAGLGF